MGKTRVKTEAEQAPVPQSAEEASAAVAEIGRAQRERERLKADMNDELAVIKQRYEDQAIPLGKRIEALTQGVKVWCEAHRADLTNGNKVKFARLPSGEVSWRMRPPSIRIKGVEAVLELLRSMGLQRFIRTKVEADKEAMLREPDVAGAVKGISITQVEDFIIKPFETELEEVAG